MRISVLTPSFNSRKYIDRAIRSVVAQQYQDFEHIIVDGGSTDGTIEILERYPHLIWTSEPDKGQSDAMNKAFMKSSGDIIVYLNSDDEFEHSSFASVVEMFTSNPDVDIIVGNLKICNKDIEVIHSPPITLSEILQLSKDKKFPLNPVSYFYRRSLQLAIGPFPLTNHYSMDYWFLLRAFLMGTPMKTEQILGTFHSHGENKTSDIMRARKSLRDERFSFVISHIYFPPVFQFALQRTVALWIELFRKSMKKLLKIV